MANDSMGQLNEVSPEKPSVNANPLIFDMEDMEVDIPQTSVMSLDSKRPSRRHKARFRN